LYENEAMALTARQHRTRTTPAPSAAPASPALAHALAAARRGFPVIPLSPSKLPALRSPHHGEELPAPCHGECGRPGHGVHDATTDPARIRELFAAAPRATGYGIACGRAPYHLIGIDLDITGTRTGPGHTGPGTAVESGSAAALRDLALRHLFTIPETVTVLTPSGGRHLWLRGPRNATVPNSAGRLAPGIDVRGSGGYLVGPGSVSAHGAYRFAPGSAALDPAPCPRALLRLLTPPVRPHHPAHHGGEPAREAAHPASARETAHGQGLIHFVRAAHEGQRNTRLFWAACRAYENGFGELLTDELARAAVRTGLTDHEARATIASARRLTGGRRRF
jgi:hypothetical protein